MVNDRRSPPPHPPAFFHLFCPVESSCGSSPCAQRSDAGGTAALNTQQGPKKLHRVPRGALNPMCGCLLVSHPPQQTPELPPGCSPHRGLGGAVQLWGWGRQQHAVTSLSALTPRSKAAVAHPASDQRRFPPARAGRVPFAPLSRASAPQPPLLLLLAEPSERRIFLLPGPQPRRA